MGVIITGHEIDMVQFKKPFRIMVAGGSGCGKTEFVRNLINSEFHSNFDRIIYNYPHYLDDPYVEFKNHVEYQPGLIDQNFISSLKPNSLIIIDDMAREVSKSDDMLNLFSVEARKRNINIIFITQNLYLNNEIFRHIKLNCTGFVLFKFQSGIDKNKRILRDLDKSNIISDKMLNNIYRDPYKYIYIDLHPSCQNDFGSVRGNIFSQYIELFCKMKYIAIKESDFNKYFKILDSKNGEIKAIKNEKNQKSKKRKAETTETESSSESE